MKAEEKKEGLHYAITQVMKEVKNIDKNTSVGSGNYGYKGVSDKDVKQLIGQAMSKNGLTCVPVKIEPTVTVDRWEEETNYNNQKQVKQKQSVFTEILATYQITHAETGESIQIMGYGHGQDAMDKSAGKATTYALKNALLYSFLVPTGQIEDTDNTHSEEIKAPATKPTLTPERFLKAIEAVKSGDFSPEELKNRYNLKEVQIKKLAELV